MSYTELESGYQHFHCIHPSFYIGDDCKAKEEVGTEDRMDTDEGQKVIVGICAMEKKSFSKAMQEILTRLEEFKYIKPVIFSEDVILKEAVENWPVCDCLISFHSKGFPLDKAVAYANLRKPFIINDLHTQYDIQDRRKVHGILQKEGIKQPRFASLDRDSSDPNKHELIESEDHIEVNGLIFNKPFVEKPVSAEDHNIYIYYPTSAGGGSQRLFRKIGSRSSVYSPGNRVRKTGSYMYEEFMPTDGTDVKVYTVGPDYAHAEARKSPALDGKVERDSEGKEVRYPVILNNVEKLIARKVCLAFNQTVCGFDLLRANGKSYVCDVNGFSFVKNSMKYYDDCAKILGNMIMRELSPQLHIPWSIPFQLDDPPIVPTTFGKMMELRCVIGIMRHGDRTPKQKMKMEVKHPKFFTIFEKYNGFKSKAIKLKKPKQLQEILDVARFLLNEIQHKTDPEIEEKQAKLEQLKSVLEMYGHFSGINRKVQLRYQAKGKPKISSGEDDVSVEPSLVLILKWGGELTPTGRVQAEELGRVFRCMYPGGQGQYAGAQGLGLMRLHSTYRHDLKIYASDEGRVQMTAAAFAKGLLSLEGELTPILVQMVKSANTNGLLDNDCDSFKYQARVKKRLHAMMQKDSEFTDEDGNNLNPTGAHSINNATMFIKNPVSACNHVYRLVQQLRQCVEEKQNDPRTTDTVLYHRENWDLMRCRWGKLEKDFKTKNGTYDISKIPDIYDCIKYDLQHNHLTLQFPHAEELYNYAKALADIVIPQEYGITQNEKLAIGQGICQPLLKKIRADLMSNIEESSENECDEIVNRLNPRYSHGVCSPGRHVKTRLYFTSESHIHSLLTILRYGGLLDLPKEEQWSRAMDYVAAISELNYMTQVVIMLYEDPTKDISSDNRFHIELHFSPGVVCSAKKNLPPGPGFRPKSRNGTEENRGSLESIENSDLIDQSKENQFDEAEEETLMEDTASSNEKECWSAHEECPSIVEEPDLEKTKDGIEDGVNAANDQAPVKVNTNKSSDPINIHVSSHRRSLATKEITTTSSEPPRGSRRNSIGYQRPHSLDETIDASDLTKIDKSCQSLDNITDDGSDILRRQRHSIPASINNYMQVYMEFPKIMGSSGSLFSTAIISGSTSAPDLKLKHQNAANLQVSACPGVPGIRPLETLHNALSLKQLDEFLGRMINANFRTPLSSPAKIPSSPVTSRSRDFPTPLTIASPTNSANYSGPPSFVSSSGPSSPNSTALDIFSRLKQVSEFDASMPGTHFADYSYPNTMSSSQTSSIGKPSCSATPSPPDTNKR